MNLSWKTIVTSFGLLLGMLSPMLAYAGCSQGDLKGTWYAYALSVDSSSFYPASSTSCKLKVDGSGKISTKSICNDRSYGGNDIVFVTGGSIKVSKSCSLEGKVKMDSTLGPQTLKIDFGTLEKGKATFSANGYIAEYPAIVSHVNGARKHW